MILVLLALVCGVDHWPEKVLRDPGAAVALVPAPEKSSIAQLGALPRTSKRRAYVVVGKVAAIKTEADGDRHVILREGVASIIVELPNPKCATGSLALAAIRRAWLQAAGLRVGQRVRATGMLFFDRPHGQSGKAPNSAELHPLFRVEVLR